MREDLIIKEITRAYLQECADTQRTFAENRLIPALERDGVRVAKSPKTVGDYSKQIAVMQNQFTKIMNETLSFPLSWKWSWVSALPEPYQTRCIHELKALLPSTVPSEQNINIQADVGRLSIEAGEAITALAVIAADGAYDAHDSVEDVKTALNELYDVRDQASENIAVIEHRTGVRVGRSGPRKIVVSQQVTVTQG